MPYEMYEINNKLHSFYTYGNLIDSIPLYILDKLYDKI